MTHHPDIEREVARRLDQITQTPGAILKYDRNGDGRLDEHEWEIVRALIRRQILAERTSPSGFVAEPASVSVASGTPASSRDEASGTPASSRDEASGTPASSRDEWGVDTDPHIDMTVQERLGQRFEILHELGRGAQGHAYLGRDLDSNRFVAMKEFVFGDVESWKAIELFEREQQALARLDHPSIPTFVDAVEIEQDGASRLFLVQEFIEGMTLEAELESYGATDEAYLRDVAEQVLEILVYLQSFSPALIHRDIKPANLIRQPSGRITLVDFGAVQIRRSTEDIGGSTVVGTTGYMPPEQLMGRANSSTDLYGLGATLVHLATGHHPAQLPEVRAKLDWRKYASVGDEFERFVERLIEPIAEDRFANAAQAKAALHGESNALGRGTVQHPAERASESVPFSTETNLSTLHRSGVFDLERTDDRLRFATHLHLNFRRVWLAGLCIIALVLFASTLGVSSAFNIGAVVLMSLLSVWQLILAFSTFELELTPDSWRVVDTYLGIDFETTGSADEFDGARVKKKSVAVSRHTVRTYWILEFKLKGKWLEIESGLTEDEQRWVARQVNEYWHQQILHARLSASDSLASNSSLM